MIERFLDPPADFEFNLESEQARNLRIWYAPIKSRGSNRIDNLAYSREGQGPLSSANSWRVDVPRLGPTLEFDGSASAGINVGAYAQHRFVDAISCFAWIYPRANPAVNTTNIIASISDSIAASGWEFGIRNDTGANRMAFAYYDGGIRGWYLDLGTPTPVNAGTLYHVGFTYQNSVLNFYVNGRLIYTPSITAGTITMVADSTRLGDQTGNFEWNGGMGDIRLYNRYLTAAEAYRLYAPETRWELYRPIARFFVVKAAAGGIAGTLNVTQAGDTLVSTAAVDIAGTLAATQANDTLTSAVAVAIAGTLSASQADNTLASDVGVVVEGTLTATQADDTLAAAGTVAIAGTLNQSQADDTLSATGEVSGGITANLNVTQDDHTLSASGQVAITASASLNQASDSLNGIVIVPIAGTLLATQDANALAATGQVMTITIVGLVEITFITRTPGATFNSRTPGATFSTRTPSVTFSNH
jgi:concanavalin A-like lectin/glucanase superfamily protein